MNQNVKCQTKRKKKIEYKQHRQVLTPQEKCEKYTSHTCTHLVVVWFRTVTVLMLKFVASNYLLYYAGTSMNMEKRVFIVIVIVISTNNFFFFFFRFSFRHFACVAKHFSFHILDWQSYLLHFLFIPLCVMHRKKIIRNYSLQLT